MSRIPVTKVRHSTLGLLLSLAVTAGAHVGDRVYPVAYLSDEMLEKIDLKDGLVDEWQELIGEPSMTLLDFTESLGMRELDPSNLDFRIWLAWHDDPPRFYLAFLASDDVYLNRATFKRCGKREKATLTFHYRVPNKPPGSRRATEGESRHERIYPRICSPVHAHVRHVGVLGPILDPGSVATGSGGGSDGVSGTNALPAAVRLRRYPRLPQRIRQTATGVVDVGHHRGETAARSGIGRAL